MTIAEDIISACAAGAAEGLSNPDFSEYSMAEAALKGCEIAIQNEINSQSEGFEFIEDFEKAGIDYEEYCKLK